MTHPLHVAKVQSMILHNINQEKRMSQLEFTIALIKELTVDIPSLRPPSHYRVQEVRLNAYHNFPSSIPQTGKKANPTRNCTVCTFVKKRKQGESQQYLHRAESRYECKECGGIPLCIEPSFAVCHMYTEYKRRSRELLGLSQNADH